ncbi:cytidylate kinase [Aquisphaera giovannonii]|uniref:Cytidylate kinase n=1 Tax=Aquisphaera giovannonii TaxID=406548 RepID=A0A5B9VWY6_9BACT|nr:cytidylate kinase-like family protein [Aquisphaera giovannonii]QEH32843.1 cytidylate kinase [Aquisphaera giovannonii]
MYTREQAFRIASALMRSGEHPRAVQPEMPPPSFSVALSREAGSGGLLIAREVGRRLNWPVYDHELLAELARELNVHVDSLEAVDERPQNWLVECLEAFAAGANVTEANYFRVLVRMLLTLGARGECIIVGRGATVVLPPESTLRVRVVASRADRIALIRRERGLDDAGAARYVDATDQERARFLRSHFRKDLADALGYDLILNASRFSVEECAEMVIEGLQRMQARHASPKRGHAPQPAPATSAG